MSRLSENLGKKFIITGEAAPPKGPNIASFMEEVSNLKKVWSKLDAVNVVDSPGSIMLASPLACSIILKQNGIEPVYQLVCRDRNMISLQSDLLGAAAFGIENILALTGDHTSCKSSDHPKAKPVFDLDSTSLIKTATILNEGKDLGGNKINGKTRFFIGGAMAPSVKPVEGEVFKTRRKINAGASFFQTQVVFDVNVIDGFLSEYEKFFREDIRKRVLMGIVSLHTHDLIKFLKTLPGVVISHDIENRVKDSPNQMEEGVNIALELVDGVRDIGLGGVHVMTAGKPESMLTVLEGIN